MRTAEELLGMIRDRAALARHYCDSASLNEQEPPDARALSGLADAFKDTEQWAGTLKDELPVKALNFEVSADALSDD